MYTLFRQTNKYKKAVPKQTLKFTRKYLECQCLWLRKLIKLDKQKTTRRLADAINVYVTKCVKQ